MTLVGGGLRTGSRRDRASAATSKYRGRRLCHFARQQSRPLEPIEKLDVHQSVEHVAAVVSSVWRFLRQGAQDGRQADDLALEPCFIVQADMRMPVGGGLEHLRPVKARIPRDQL